MVDNLKTQPNNSCKWVGPSQEKELPAWLWWLIAVLVIFLALLALILYRYWWKSKKTVAAFGSVQADLDAAVMEQEMDFGTGFGPNAPYSYHKRYGQGCERQFIQPNVERPALKQVYDSGNSKTNAKSEPELKLIIVTAYIRECETLNNMTIPAEIRKLCYLFYSYCRRKIFLSPARTFHGPQEQSFGIYDMTSQKISVATVHENDTKYFDGFVIYHNAFCYIPQIDYLGKEYDAILTQCSRKNERNYWGKLTDNHLSLMLFESDYIDNEMIKYNLLVDPQKIEQHHQEHTVSIMVPYVRQFLYCGTKHGVIYEQKQQHLFQLQNSQMSSFDFNPIPNCMTNIFSSTNGYGNTVKWLNMCYISKLEQIFAISCGEAYRNICYRSNPSMAPPRIPCRAEAKCGIYDFNNNMWKQIQSIKFNSHEYIKEHFHCVSCSDKYENIYVLSSKTQYGLIQYDMHQNKWINIGDRSYQGTQPHSSSIWIDNDNPQILCYANASYGFKVKKFDLRNKAGKWMDDVKLDGYSDCVPFV